jgi:hypothetical protein
MLAWLALLFVPLPTDASCVVWLSTEELSRYGVRVRAETTVEAPVDEVLRTLEDFDHYREFMPRVRRAERRPGGLVYTEIASPWPLKDVWFLAAVQRQKLPEGYVLRWSMRAGNIRENTGAWWLRPLGNGRTRLRYEGTVSLFHVIPPLLLRLVEEHELPRVVQALRVRAAHGAPLRCRETVMQLAGED